MICHRCGGKLKLIPNGRISGADIAHEATGLPCCPKAYRKQSWMQKLDEPKQLEIAEIYGVIQI